MSYQELKDVMNRFEARFEVSLKDQVKLYDERDAKIQQVLASWAKQTPQWAKERYQYRLDRTIDYCLHRRFIHVFHNPRTREIIVSYGDKLKPEMSISITKDHILARDPDANYVEMLFPLTWPEQSPDTQLMRIEEVSQMSAVEWD
jgi:hypothetical protein